VTKKRKSDVEEIVGARIVRNHIRECLDENEMSQTEFADRVGISYRHGNRIIKNTSEPSYLLAYKMALVLKRDPQDLFEVEVRKRRVSRSKAMVITA
jgi:DNA-binding XRE family transcriptional regulator